MANEKGNNYIQIVLCAVLLTGAYCLMIMMTGVRYVLPFAAGLPVAFLIPQFACERSRKTGLIVSGVLLAAALVFLVIMRTEIIDGIFLVMNSLFEASEKTQAYLYDKFDISRDPGSYMECMRYAVLWTGAVAGALLSFVPLRAMKWICCIVCVLCGAGFAYFGILPQAIPALVMVAALTAVLAGGKLRAALPVVIAGVVVFSLILAISPGENKAVSKVDENLRDKLATSTVSIIGSDSSESESGKAEQNKDENDDGGQSLLGGGEKSMKVWIVLGLVLLTAMILFIPAVIHDRLEKRRKKNRKGIDSPDPKTAVCAMFPYAVRWLAAGGLETGNVPFAELAGGVREMTSADYAAQYDDMLVKWKEAAYSNYAFGEDDRSRMKEFMDRTIADVREKMSLKDKLKVRFVTAL